MNFANSFVSQEQSNKKRLMGVYCIQPSLASIASCIRCQAGVIIYLHIRGAFGVARFDKLGDARASTRGTSDKNRLRAFSYAFKPSINYVNMVAIGKEEN